MIRTVRQYIDKEQLLRPHEKIIIGYSGGMDSVSLLNILHRLDYTCIVAHCHFHLRGEEADQDALFARQTATTLQLPYEQIDFDTTSYAATHHLSIEMAARTLRYEWFETLRVKHQARVISVAHHRDDSVETLLINLMRGTGIRGLSGIRPRQGAIVRPLLCVDRKEITHWVESQHLAYRTDSSNLTDEYRRNYIRHHLLPLMERINPSARKAVLRTSHHMADMEMILLEWIERERPRVMPDDSTILIAPLMESAAPKTLLYELIKPYGFTRLISESIYESLTGTPGKQFSAPTTGIQLIKDREALLLTAYKEVEKSSYTIDVDETIIHPLKLSLEKRTIDGSFTINKEPSVGTFDFEKLSFPLTIRRWKEGDWFIPFGMKGRKKVSDYFSDHKFSRFRKEATWLLCHGEEIIWIIGERTDERYRLHGSGKIALIATLF